MFKNARQLFVLFIVLSINICSAQDYPQELLFSTFTAEDFQVLDFDQDGKEDILSLNGSGVPQIFINGGDNTFSGPSQDLFPDEEMIQREYGLIDYDMDGDYDILSSNCASCSFAGMVLFENYDNKSFSEVLSLEAPFGGFRDTRFLNRDFDGDGDVDILMYSQVFTKQLYIVFENNGDKTFTKSFEQATSLSTKPQKMFLSDIDNNGVEELLVFSGSNVNVYNFTINSLDLDSADPLGASVNNTLSAFDFNRDDIDDYYYVVNRQLYVLVSDGFEGFLPPISYYSGSIPEIPAGLIDLDSDGDFDLVYGKANTQGVFSKDYESGSWSAENQISTVGEQILHARAINLDNDSAMELVLYGYQNFLGVLDLEEGNKTHVIADLIRYQNIEFDALDEDHIANDVVLFYDRWVGVKKWNGTSFDNMKTIHTSLDRINDVKSIDIDNDGDRDMLIIYNRVDNALTWLENVGGEYENETTIPTNFNEGQSMLVADFDQDTDQDIILMGDSDVTTYLSNNGDGTFEEQSMMFTASNGRKIDINQDGFLDLLTWYNGGSGHYFENDQMGGWLPVTRLVSGSTPTWAHAYDWDGDGDLDPTYALNGGSVVLYENQEGDFSNEVVLADNLYASSLEIVDTDGTGPGIITGAGLTYLKHETGFNFNQSDSPLELYFEQMYLGDPQLNGEQDLLASTTSAVYWYPDFSQLVQAVDSDMDGFNDDIDCDDTNPDIYPGAPEIPNNGIDEDCDGEDLTLTVYTPIDYPSIKQNNSMGVSVLLDQYVSIKGVVNTPNFRAPQGEVLLAIVDREGGQMTGLEQSGVWIYSPDELNNVSPVLGDLVEVKGQVIQFNGLTEIVIDELVIEESNQDLAIPADIDNLDESTEGELVTLWDVRVKDPTEWKGDGSTFNVTMTRNGVDFVVRIYAGTDLSMLAPFSSRLAITGFGGQYDTDTPFDSGYQLVPRDINDISIKIATYDDEIQALSFYPNPVIDRIFIDEENLAFTEIRIIDLIGKQISSLNVNETKHGIDVSVLEKGTYILTLVDGNKVVAKNMFIKP